MRVLIFGGRDFVAEERHWRFTDIEISNFLHEDDDVIVISGGAKGADKFGEYWAESAWFPVEVYPADWDKYGTRAGPIRNQQMLDSGIDLAIQFPGGRGTADMRKRLDNAGVHVVEYKERNEEATNAEPGIHD